MKMLVLVLLTLLGLSFAQSESSGITFADFLNSQQMQMPDTTTKIDTVVAKPAVVAPSPARPPAPPPTYASYEAFLDSIEAYINDIQPEKERLDSQKALVNAETASPKDEFEKQVDYEKRLADFEKEKQQKILALEQEFQEKTKGTMEKLRSAIAFKEDIQPNWGGMLQKDASIEAYKERIDDFNRKITAMKARISYITTLFGKLQFSKSDEKTLPKYWQEKSLLYISRLEKACELMQDYILQEQAKILSTERYKFDMSLGAYNADNEEFLFSMNDIGSPTVPFDYNGIVKMSPAQAKETNKQTDNFTASVDYINYPLIVNGANLYPGVKKAHVFYKEQEVQTNGVFKPIPSLEGLNGYSEWVQYANQLLTGKLAPRNLDSLYAMKGGKITLPKVKDDDGSTFWTGKNIFRVVMFGLSAASVGLGLLQNSDVASKNDTKNQLYQEAYYAQGTPEYNDKFSKYEKSKDDLKSSENLRNAYYLGAGVFGIAGAVSIIFF